MPLWLTFVLMVLAAYRLSRLIVRDTFPPVLWVRDRLAGGWRPLTSPELADARVKVKFSATKEDDTGRVVSAYIVRKAWSPYWLAELLSCTWCASGWVSGAVTAAVAVTVGLPSPWLVGPAVWGAAAWILSKE